MTQRLHLYIPTYDELYYRKKILSQPETMSYNRGYDLSLSGYDKSTGCINFPRVEWKKWYDFWVGNEPYRYYAYITRNVDNTFIGEVNLHLNPNTEWYDMGIVIEAMHRGKSYGVEILKLLLKQAFEVFDAKAVHNDFESVRVAAVKTHLSAGFTKYKETNGILELIITKEQYNILK